MKTYIFKCSPISVYTIVISIMTLFVFSSCESNDLQLKSQADTETPILPRTITECDDCPVGYCCAAIELLEGATTTVEFCGVYTAMSGSLCGPFSPGSPCGTVSGTSSSIGLSGNGDRKLFCVPNGGSFRIVGPSGGPYSVRISTDYDEVNPTWENLDLDTTPLYYDTDGNCTLSEC